MGENTGLGMYVRSSNTDYFCQYVWMTLKMSGKKQNMAPMWKKLMKIVDIDDHIISWPCTQRECKPNETIIEQYEKMFESRISAEANEKLPGWEKSQTKTVAWSYDMEGHAQKCVERYSELANKKVEQLYKISSPCLDDQVKQEELESIGEVSEVCSQIVLKCLYDLDDLTPCGRSTSLRDHSQNGLKHVTDA